jgi:hypothetical protein
VVKIKALNPRASDMKKQIELAMKQQYIQIPADEDGKIIDGIQKFMIAAQQQPATFRRIIHEAALMIYRVFPFKEITIGLKSPVDGRYRYEEIVGHSKTAEQALKQLAYTYEEFFSAKDYPAIRLSKFTELALVEEQPFLEHEKETYNRPILLSGVRNSTNDFVEGDYLDVYMYDSNDVMIGWIELSLTKDGKLPSMRIIKWLELFASVLSIILQRIMYTKKA